MIPADARTGTTVGKYKLHEIVGRGGQVPPVERFVGLEPHRLFEVRHGGVVLLELQEADAQRAAPLGVLRLGGDEAIEATTGRPRLARLKVLESALERRQPAAECTRHGR